MSEQPTEIIGPPDPAATLINKDEEPKPIVYEQEEVACSLTLDAKQAWILQIVLAPYSKAEEDDWDMLRAASDIHRRLTDAVGQPF